jgi:hypothetical protein
MKTNHGIKAEVTGIQFGKSMVRRPIHTARVTVPMDGKIGVYTQKKKKK